MTKQKQIDDVVKKLVKLRRMTDNLAIENEHDELGDDIGEKLDDLAIESSMTISETLGLLNLLKSLVQEENTQ